MTFDLYIKILEIFLILGIGFTVVFVKRKSRRGSKNKPKR